MKYSEANIGRIFILRLEDGEQIPETIEVFARNKKIESATVFFIGAANKESKIVVGPKDGSAKEPISIIKKLTDVSEVLGIGTIFCNEENIPKLHLHSAFGRNDGTITGCTREGVNIWHVGEVIILELINCTAQRKIDPQTGFELLELL